MKIGRPIEYPYRLGDKHGQLTILRRSEKKKYVFLICQCDCGKEAEVLWSNLRRGLTSTCGHGRGRWEPIRETRVYSAILSQYKGGAKDRGLSWNLSREQFIELTKQNCFYCGTAPSRPVPQKMDRKSKAQKERPASDWPIILYNGIDRRDSGLGYTPENCVPCCFTCNRAKWTYAEEEFLSWVCKIYLHSAGLKNKLVIPLYKPKNVV